MSTQSKTPAIWRSLAEKADPRRRERAANEEVGIQLGSLLPENSLVNRRTFMTVTGATAAAVGLSGCLRRPSENILPYSQAPEYSLPGASLHYATSTSHMGEAVGLLVESHEGRPTKIEGNPTHPASQGSTDALLQARILDLYDPDRSAHVRQGDTSSADSDSTWAAFDGWWREKGSELEANGGAGLRVLMRETDSPSVLRARRAFETRFPDATVHTWSAVSHASLRGGSRLAFGTPKATRYEMGSARTILALDSDFLASEPGFLRHARGFADGRRMTSAESEMNRLYVVEGTLSVTGMSADHRLRLAPSQVDGYLRALALALIEEGVRLPPETTEAVHGATSSVPEAWLGPVAADLAANRSRCAVVVGSRQPLHVHALAHAINVGLGNLGTTVQSFPAPDSGYTEGIAELVEAMGEGVDTLLILDGNPIYDAPADLGFADALGSVENTIHLSSYVDETSAACSWHLPMAHELESWGDHTSAEGIHSIQQPLIAPLRGGRSAQEVFAAVAGIRAWRGYHLVRRTLRERAGAADFERLWRESLHSGVVDFPVPRPASEPLQDGAIARALRMNEPTASAGWEAVFISSYQTYDGAWVNNPWMLEMPDPVTKMVWDNAAYVSPTSAAELGVSTGDLLTISIEGAGEATIPALVLPGHADEVVTLPLGFGRTRAGRHGTNVGFDVYPLRTSGSLGFATGVSVRSAGGSHEIVTTQEHHSMSPRSNIPGYGDVQWDERAIVVYADLEQYREQPEFGQWAEPNPTLSPLWSQVDYSLPRPPPMGGTSYQAYPTPREARDGAPPRYKWGYVIDLTTCTGCSACVIACQAENNIAVIGKRQVQLGREMHWMRLDRYFVGDDAGDPQMVVQPVGCQHCEEAPCENVCPVNATSHTAEGLNDMAYNRCIGTRYCMNNCPYKVRRFNFLDWHGEIPELRKMQFNPNVTVRMRGVMEKCSYCVQRIQYARIQARLQTTVTADGEIDERRIRDHEVTPACAQACPSGAIAFGDLNDTSSDAHRQSHVDRRYSLLASVGAQPRTTFLGKVRNPNPEMG